MIFHELEHLIGVPWVIQATLFAAVLLLVCGFMVRARVAGPRGGVIPDEGTSVRNVLEVLVAWLAGMAQDRMGPNWRRYFPLIGTLFFFILISNVIGLVPGFLGATGDVNMTAACAVVVWVFYTAIGITTHGWKYVLKFTGPGLFDLHIGGRHIHVRALAPLFLPLELLLDLARMLTLAVRLLANMFADHTVVAVWLAIVPFAVPAIFMGLGLIVAFLQAFVFALLAMIYIGLSLDEPH
ncbi:MAG TPA: F0F1 ATP synthase subunit A [Myxococcota bacterium]|nr:F0F1 ATP synthase subunit A [Myxococcota bacterium]